MYECMYVCIFEHTHSLFLLHCERPSLNTYTKQQAKLQFCIFLDSKPEEKNSVPNDSKNSLTSVCS